MNETPETEIIVEDEKQLFTQDKSTKEQEQRAYARDTLSNSGPLGFPPTHPVIYTTPKDVSKAIPLETLTVAIQQLTSSLAKQNLPKCHPEVFSGDVAMFSPPPNKSLTISETLRAATPND